MTTEDINCAFRGNWSYISMYLLPPEHTCKHTSRNMLWNTTQFASRNSCLFGLLSVREAESSSVTTRQDVYDCQFDPVQESDARALATEITDAETFKE